MNQHSSTVSRFFISLASFVSRPKNYICWALVTLLLAVSVAHAAPEDNYFNIMGLFRHADKLVAKGETQQAHADYLKAERELQIFQRANPNWQQEIVNFRLNYLARKVRATAPQPATVKSQPSAAKPAAAPAKTILPVKVLTAGSQPRKFLSLHPKVGDKQTLDMTMKMAMNVSFAGHQRPPVNIPPMTTTMTVEVKDISTNGDIHYSLSYDDLSLAADTNTPPAVVAAMKTALGSIKGMTSTGVMTSQGLVKSMHANLPAGMPRQLSQVLGQMKESFSSACVPLPDEPIGPGAKWKHTVKIKSQGITMEQTATYELVSIDGDSIKLNSTLSLSAPHQEVHNPAMPGLKLEVSRLTGAGTGKTTVNLARIMPQSASMTENTDMAMSVNMGQKKQDMAMKMNVQISMETK